MAGGMPNGLPGMPGVPGGPPGNQRFIVGPNGQLLPAGMNNGMPGQGGASQSSVAGNGGFGASVSGNGGYGSAPTGVNGAGTNGVGPNGMPNNPANPYGAPVNSQFQGQSPYSTAQNPNGFSNNNFNQPGQQTSPAQMINNLLTSPRPGGAPAGIGGGGVTGTVVGGLAGVATTVKGHGIHTYEDQDEYQKWEFYYDLNKDIAAAMSRVAGQMNPALQQNINNMGNSGFGGSGSSGFSGATTPPVTAPVR